MQIFNGLYTKNVEKSTFLAFLKITSFSAERKSVSLFQKLFFAGFCSIFKNCRAKNRLYAAEYRRVSAHASFDIYAGSAKKLYAPTFIRRIYQDRKAASAAEPCRRSDDAVGYHVMCQKLRCLRHAAVSRKEKVTVSATHRDASLLSFLAAVCHMPHQ